MTPAQSDPVEPAPAPTGARTEWGWSVAFVAALLPLAGLAAHYLAKSLGAIQFPFELDHVEGQILANAVDVLHGRPLYHFLSAPPYTVVAYPPIYPGLVALLSSADPSQVLATGRAVAFCSGIAVPFLCAWIAHLLLGQDGRARSHRWFGPLAAALGVFAFRPYLEWAALMRVDYTALALALAAFGVYVRWQGTRWAWLAAPLWVAALFTKQSMLGGLAACLVHELRFHRRTAPGMLAILGVLAGTAYGALDLATHGAFTFGVVTGQVHAWDWAAAFEKLAVLVPELSLYVLLVLAAFMGLPGTKGSRLLGLFVLLAAVLDFVTIGKVGSNLNHLLELVAALAIMGGVVAGELFSGAYAGRPVVRAAWIAVVAGTVLVHHQALRWNRWVFVSPGTAWAERTGKPVLEAVRAAPGRVLSENLTFASLAGKQVEYQLFDLVQLQRKGRWDQRPLLEDIEQRAFVMVLLEFDLSGDPGWHADRFTPEMIAALRANYVMGRQIGAYTLYVPAGDAQAARNVNAGGT
jgi:hypothetical protein